MKFLNKNSLNSVSIHISLFSHKDREMDITEIFSDFEIIEDVNNFTLTGSISIIDTVGLKEFFPITGGEKLKVLFNTGDDFSDFKSDFYITKLANEEQIVSQRNVRILKLFFTSEEFLTNYKKQYSKSYYHETVSNIVQDVFSSQLLCIKSLNLEVCKNTINYIIPYKNPFDTINFCCKHALSNVNNDSGYLFFETKEGYNFVSIIGMMDNKTENKKIVLQRFTEGEERKLVGYVGVADYFYPIKQIDLVENIKKGVTGQTLITFDWSTKSYMKHVINHEKSSTNTILGNNLMFQEGFMNPDSDVDIFDSFINDRIGSGIEYQNSITEQSKIFLRNNILYKSINNNSIVVSKPGDSDLMCGKVIECELKSSDNEENYDSYLNGWFFIKAIRHKITIEEGYKQLLHLSKPFYSKDEMNITKKI